MLDDTQRKTLKAVARASIEHGLAHGNALQPSPDEYDESLQNPGASFVTLQEHGELRGCIGMLQAVRPLVSDVAANAWAAAFQDSRFLPLQSDELEQLDIHISILGEAEAIEFSSEQDLLQQINQGEDGIILGYGSHRATFLPSVWQQVSGKAEFLQHLKRKAGLPADFWDDAIEIQRYQVEEF